MRSWVLSGVLIAACAHAPGASAQTADAVSSAVSAVTPSTRVFKASVNLVALSVTVTDGQERHVPGLASGDFAVFENGAPQDIAFFAAESTPLDLAILLDTSASMRTTLRTAQEAAVLLARALRPGDRASFIEVKRSARTLQPLSGDFGGLETAIRATQAEGGTAIFEAVYVALRELSHAAVRGEVRRQAMVILSDGDDTASLIPFDDVLDAARRSGVAIYGVSLRPPPAGSGDSRAAIRDGNRIDGDFALQAFATQTGGRAYFHVEAARDLVRTCRAIALELASQYSLGYVSTDPREDGQFRQVQIRVLHPADARARTRPGYFATHHPALTRRPAAGPQEGVATQ
jgi:Ca-activated chloride channel family protein